MIKAIIFDVSGVIITRFSDIGERLEPILKIDCKKIHSKFKGEEFQDFLRGKISEDEYWKKIIKNNGWMIDVSIFKKARRESFKKIDGTKEIIKWLSKKGIKLGILSSHTREWVAYLRENFDYERYFDVVHYSYQVGHKKPERVFYKGVVGKLEVDPFN